MKEQVVVASTNPAKLQATRDAFATCFPGRVFDVHGVPVPSGVAEQPLTDDETLQGARNRAVNAREASPHAHYWVGLEGGIDEAAGEMRSFAWVFILDAAGLTGKGRTATLYLPPRVMELIRQGKELGEADDIVFGVANSKTRPGAAGLLTKGIINRAELYKTAAVMALIPFMNPDLYPPDS